MGGTGIPYLTDFGTAHIELEKRVPLCNLSSGTLPYLSPESLTESRRHSYQSDFWSLGVLAFELLFNIRPFDKHCPKSFIYFVDNQYRLMWNFIENNNSIGNVNIINNTDNNHHNNDNNLNNNNHNNNNNTNNNNLNTNNNNHNNNQFILSSSSSFSASIYSSSHSMIFPHSQKLPPFDFEQVCNSIDEEIRLKHLPYPQHNISLLNNGNLPFELVVHIPNETNVGEPISPECRAMLNGLLDVRIPLRLGNLSHYSEFSNHPWLQKFPKLTSFPPFNPQVDQVADSLTHKYIDIPLQFQYDAFPSVPVDIEDKLLNYSFAAEHSLVSIISPSHSIFSEFKSESSHLI